MSEIENLKETSVRVQKKGEVLHVELDRPNAINALNLSMVNSLWKALKSAQDDDSIAIILLTGRGERGFCAGGDVKSVCQNSNELLHYAEEFFQFEYLVDEALFQTSKPVVCFGHGITMGGGLGLFMGSSHRIAFENSLFAMPETAIGFFPDVGATYFLKKIWKPAFGRFLALSGLTFNGADALAIHCANTLLSNTDLPHVLDKIENSSWSKNHKENHAKLDKILEPFQQTVDSTLVQSEKVIAEIFLSNSLEEVVNRWSRAVENCALLNQGWKNWLKGSALSQQVIWQQLQQDWNRTEAAVREWDIALQMCQDSDFHEGVRAQLIDKDKSPQWKFHDWKEVPDEVIQRIMTPLKQNPLRDYFSAAI